jgi:hypothetical protein
MKERLEEALQELPDAYFNAPPGKGWAMFLDGVIRLMPVIVSEGAAGQVKQMVDACCVIHDKLMGAGQARGRGIYGSGGDGPEKVAEGMRGLRDMLNRNEPKNKLN